MNKPGQKTIRPGLLELKNKSYAKINFTFSTNGITFNSKNSSIKEVNLHWDNIECVRIYKNSPTLGLVHFLLIILLARGILTILFLPHIIFYLFKSKTVRWAGYILIKTNKGIECRYTPLGWTRLGFHMSEPAFVLKKIKEYAPDAKVDIVDHAGAPLR